MGNTTAPEGYTDFVARFRISDAHMHYLESSARLRGVSTQGLIRKLIYIVCRDVMVASITDGDDLRKVDDGLNVRGKKPKDRVFDALPRKNKYIVSGIEDVTDEPKKRAPRHNSIAIKRGRPPVKSPSITPTSSVTQRRPGGSVPITRVGKSVRTLARQPQKTKGELRRELEEAVRNTAAMPIED